MTRVVLLSLIACGGSSDAPKPAAGSGSAPGSAIAPTAPATGIHVPVVAGVNTAITGNLALALADDGARVLGPITTDSRPAIGGAALDVDDHGQLRNVLPAGDPATPASLDAAAAKVPPGHTIVFAEPTRKAALLDGLHAIGLSCTNLAVASGGHLAAVPICFPKATTGALDDRAELVTKIAPAETDVILTRLDHLYVAHDAAELDGILAEQKASSYFHDRTDAAIVVDREATIGQLATAVAALRKAGFVDIRWMIEPEPPKVVDHPSGAITPSATDISVTIDCPRVDGGSIDEGARVVKARTGVFRACFQKELKRGAHDGAADISFGVDNGKATSITIAGNSPSAAVDECTKANIQRLTFPAGISAVRCAFTYKHVASGGR